MVCFSFYFREEKEQLAKIKTELFDKKQSVTKCITTAPVATFIKQRLNNVEDSEVIQSKKHIYFYRVLCVSRINLITYTKLINIYNFSFSVEK